MPTAQNLGNSLVECLREVASLLGHAHLVALKQQEALVANDAEAIATTARSQEEILRRIAEADQRAAAVANQIVEAAQINPEEATIEAIAKATGEPYAELIDREVSRISAISKSLRQANEINSTLIANGLDIIACCLRTIATEQSMTSYTGNASVNEPQPCVLSLDKLV